MKIEAGQKIRFDVYDRIKARLMIKQRDSADDSHIYGVSKHVYKEYFENKDFTVKGTCKTDASFEVYGSGYVFDEAFIKGNILSIDSKLFKME